MKIIKNKIINKQRNKEMYKLLFLKKSTILSIFEFASIIQLFLCYASALVHSASFGALRFAMHSFCFAPRRRKSKRKECIFYLQLTTLFSKGASNLHFAPSFYLRICLHSEGGEAQVK
uniref:Uncharacterized protein n=1 Tax=Pseudopediastrum boryanum TaxID=55410 RepID=A0A2U8GJD3_PSEBY|nr:hypothetical protein [Pseudopediastrum boryanum]